MATLNGTPTLNGDPMDPYEYFVALHRNQLETSVVPEHFWPTLFKKISRGIFDAGETFSLVQVQDEGTKMTSWKVLVNQEVSANDSQHIYLVDHAWTFKPENAREHLREYPGLLERMAKLFELDQDTKDLVRDSKEHRKLIDDVMDIKWKFAQFYSLGSATTIEERMPVWYIMDEFGSRIQHSDIELEKPTFRLVPFMYITEGCGYSLLFPIKDLCHQEEVTRDYLEGPEAQDSLTRQALMNIWRDTDLKHLDWRQVEPESEFFSSSRTNESLPDADFVPKELPKDRKIKVYTEYVPIGDNLSHDQFEMVDNTDEADIVWKTTHHKLFKEFSIESPHKRINQFPYEHVLTIKDLLCIVCRRMKSEDDENEPKWLPTTFNMKTELAKFVSHYQHREREGLDNHWIVKPWNLARGLDTHVSNNLPHILKQEFTGPKIVQKYLHDPVLYERPGIGGVKFDIRYILLLRSVDPLKVYAYDRFWLRFANQKFELNQYDVYEKHFTVMNYGDAHLEQMYCHDFIKEFEVQYPDFKWSEVQGEIFRMLKEVFQGACKLPPPQGIGQNPQSRAMYAVDLMLKWNRSQCDALPVPQILEINWGPDCKRACDYYPEYFNDVFSTLYLDQPKNSTLL